MTPTLPPHCAICGLRLTRLQVWRLLLAPHQTGEHVCVICYTWAMRLLTTRA